MKFEKELLEDGWERSGYESTGRTYFFFKSNKYMKIFITDEGTIEFLNYGDLSSKICKIPPGTNTYSKLINKIDEEFIKIITEKNNAFHEGRVELLYGEKE